MPKATRSPIAPRRAHILFRPAPLAASMALLWSATTLATPGEPVLDWMETHYKLLDPDRPVQVAVNWNRFFEDPAISARYWRDDALVLSRAVEDGDIQTGEGSFAFAEGGTYELSVELCDKETCTASEPILISVFDPWADPESAGVTDTDIDEGMRKIEEAQRIIEQSMTTLALDQAALEADPSRAGWGVWLASMVGQSALKYGLNIGFDALITRLGLGANGAHLAGKLAGINQSLDAISTWLDVRHPAIIGMEPEDAVFRFRASQREHSSMSGNLN